MTSIEDEIIQLFALNRELQELNENGTKQQIRRIKKDYKRIADNIKASMNELYNKKGDMIMSRIHRGVEVENVAVNNHVQSQPVDLTSTDNISDRDKFLQYVDRRNREIREQRRTQERQARREQERREQERREQETREQERREQERREQERQARREQERQARQARREQEMRLIERLKLNIKVKALKKSVADACVDSECSICLETPKVVNSSITNCGHKFCGACLDNWVFENKKITCPACRTILTCIQSFKPRKTPVRSGAIAVV